MSSYDKNMIPLQNSARLLDLWKEAKEKIGTAMLLLREAKRIMGTAFGEHRDTVLPAGFCDYSLQPCHGDSCFPKDVETLLRRHFWTYIVDKTEMRKMMSLKRQDELNRQLFDESGSLPEPSTESLAGFLDANLGRAKTFAKEAVDEVFQWLRPNRDFHDFKSNARFEIGKKVLLNGVMDTKYFVRLSTYHAARLVSMDNMFHALDGKGFQTYPNDIVTAIETACNEKRWSAETEYFRLEWYKKGSMHIEFKRLDLVAELNRIAGGATLKCS